MKKTQILTLINLFCLILLFAISAFYPIIFAVAVIFLVPITIYLIYRMNFLIPIIISITGLVLPLVFNFSIIYLIFAIIYVFSCIGGVFAIKLKTFGKSTLVTAVAVLLAFVLIIGLSYIFYEKSPLEASYDVITESSKEYVYDIAKRYNIFYMYNANDYATEEESKNAITDITNKVNIMPEEEVLHNFACAVRYYMYANFATIMFGYIVAIGIFTYIYLSYVCGLFIAEQNLEKKGFIKSNIIPIDNSRKVRLPKGYFLGVGIPLAIFYLIQGTSNTMLAIYEVIYYDLFMIPFLLFGLFFVFHIKELEIDGVKFSGFDYFILVMLLMILNYRLLLIFGLIDYILDLKNFKANYEKAKNMNEGE